MRILALIPARGGSKRIPGKNIRLLGGKPLIAWSIEAAKATADICDVLVSTDDAAIAKIAADSGAWVPWLRPARLATDEATSVDVCLHALDWYETEKGRVDGLLLLQPTSPFRRQRTLREGVKLYEARTTAPVLGVSAAHSHPLWCFSITDGALRPFISGEGLQLRSQDLPPAYVVNGAFYLLAPQHLREQRSFFSSHMHPLIRRVPAESIDIDTEWDWQIAQTALAAGLVPGD